MKYTYSDEEDVSYSDSTTRRSGRNTGTNTPAEAGPVTTSSGRQIRAPPRLNVTTGDSAPASVKGDTPDLDDENSVGPTGRPRRSAAANPGTNGWTGPESRSHHDGSADSDDESEGDFGDDEEDHDVHVPDESEEEDEYDEDEAMVDDDLDDQPRSLMVKLSVTPPQLRHVLAPIDDQAANTLLTPNIQDEKFNDSSMSEPQTAHRPDDKAPPQKLAMAMTLPRQTRSGRSVLRILSNHLHRKWMRRPRRSRRWKILSLRQLRWLLEAARRSQYLKGFHKHETGHGMDYFLVGSRCFV